MRGSINPFYGGVSRKCGLLFMKKCIMRGKGFRVSPWAGRPMITCERGSAGSIGSKGSTGVVRRIKIRSAAE